MNPPFVGHHPSPHFAQFTDFFKKPFPSLAAPIAPRSRGRYRESGPGGGTGRARARRARKRGGGPGRGARGGSGERRWLRLCPPSGIGGHDELHIGAAEEGLRGGSGQTTVQVHSAELPGRWGAGRALPRRRGAQQAPQERSRPPTRQAWERPGDPPQVGFPPQPRHLPLPRSPGALIPRGAPAAVPGRGRNGAGARCGRAQVWAASPARRKRARLLGRLRRPVVTGAPALGCPAASQGLRPSPRRSGVVGVSHDGSAGVGRPCPHQYPLPSLCRASSS